MKKNTLLALASLCLLPLLFNCYRTTEPAEDTSAVTEVATDTIPVEAVEVIEPPLHEVIIAEDVTLGKYFDFMEDLVAQYDTLTPYELDEFLIAHANSWVMDSIANTDYYYQQSLGNFMEDSKAVVIFKQGDTLDIPNEKDAAILREKLDNITIDVNIPEYKLRILEGDSLLHEFLVRVGQNRSRYLAMAGRSVKLSTHPGTGEIVRINRRPDFINPANNKRYKVTRRDDGKVTKLPNIPWIEPEINGQRYGQLIHPTTNIKTLGKAYSNGCIGMRESDSWRVYFHAPLGTKVIFRYDLVIRNEDGTTQELEDIYNRGNRPMPLAASIHEIEEEILDESGEPICLCGI